MRLYAAAVYVQSTSPDKPSKLSSYAFLASNVTHAIGIAYAQAESQYPSTDGFLTPAVTIVEVSNDKILDAAKEIS